MTNMTLEYPWALALLLLLPAAAALRRRVARPRPFSAAALAGRSAAPGWGKKYGLDLLAGLFMLLVILALVNLRYASYWQQERLESKWIMIVQDLSGSMNRLADETRSLTLGDIALEGARAFVEMRQQEDLIGLVAFSSYAQLIAPPTSDKAILKDKLALLGRASDSVIFRELAAGGGTNASYAVWLALSTFFMLLPEEVQPSIEQLEDFRRTLLGRTRSKVRIPAALQQMNFGQGMAIVLFTDGRIEANKSSEDVRKGLPNFVNVIALIKQLGIKLYLIVVGGEVNAEVKAALEDSADGQGAGRIFHMPRQFDPDRIKAVYRQIHAMEQNRLLVKLYLRQKETRGPLTYAAAAVLLVYGVLWTTPALRRI